jgi:Putative porin
VKGEESDMATSGSLKRNVVVGVLLLWAPTWAPGLLFAGDGAADPLNGSAAESKAADGLTGTAGNGLRAVPPSPIAPLLLELEQLKRSVEAQAQRLAEHTQELAAERAAIAGELDEITKLESELRDTPVAPAGSAEAAESSSFSSSSAVFLAPSVLSSAPRPAGAIPGPVAQVHAPVQGNVDRRLSDLEQRMKKLGPLTFSGDFRLREDAFFGGPSDHLLDENLQNYRLRFNTDVQVNDDISGGFTLASGNINDPTSTNQTLTGFYARKPIALDRVFIHYHPHQFKALDLQAGKFSYPWYNTELTWDKDLNPEGFSQTLNFEFHSIPVLKRVAVVGFELPFAQVAGVSLQNKSLMQTAMYGGQFQTAWQLANWLNLTLYTGFYNFHNADPMALALEKATAKDPATPLMGLLPLTGGGGVPQNSIVTTTATSVVSVSGTPLPTGVTSVSNAQFASKFGLYDSLARFDVKTPSERWPVAFIGDYVQNTEACANAGNIERAPANTATTTFSQTTNFACDPRQRRAYWAEAEVGRILKQHDLQFGYTRMFIEREALLSNLNYNQIYQGSNVTEHRLSVFYTAWNNVIFDFIALLGRPLDFGSPNPPIDLLKRMQFDVNYVF